jgi:hypothetical protein
MQNGSIDPAKAAELLYELIASQPASHNTEAPSD